MVIDAARYRRAIGSFPTGVAVVSTACDGERFGMTANAVTSVTLDPPTLLVCLGTGTRTGQAVRRSGRFAINVLADDQRALSLEFARQDADRFAIVADLDDGHGLPILPDVAAHLVCRVSGAVTIGDHDVVFGVVEACHAGGKEPLVYVRSDYRSLVETAPPRSAEIA